MSLYSDTRVTFLQSQRLPYKHNPPQEQGRCHYRLAAIRSLVAWLLRSTQTEVGSRSLRIVKIIGTSYSWIA